MPNPLDRLKRTADAAKSAAPDAAAKPAAPKLKVRHGPALLSAVERLFVVEVLSKCSSSAMATLLRQQQRGPSGLRLAKRAMESAARTQMLPCMSRLQFEVLGRRQACAGLCTQVAVPNPLDGLKKSADAAKRAAPQAVQVPLRTCFGDCIFRFQPSTVEIEELHEHSSTQAFLLRAALRAGVSRGSVTAMAADAASVQCVQMSDNILTGGCAACAAGCEEGGACQGT